MIRRFGSFLIGAVLLTAAGQQGATAQGSGFHDAPSTTQKTPNPQNGTTAIQAGANLYATDCSGCHGQKGEGTGNVPPLASGAVQKAKDGEIFWFISNGSAANGMPAWSQLPETDRWQIVAYLKALPSGKAPVGVPSAAVVAAGLDAPPPAAPFTDFRYEAPGRLRRITESDLPAPYATASANSGPRVVPRPADAWPKAPPGFKVELYASGLINPRLARTAPNGDIFVAETGANRIHIFRGMTADGKPVSEEVFAKGLTQPFGIAFYPAGKDPQWIYVGDTNAVLRFPYRSGDLTVRGSAEKLADLPTGGHSTRDIQFAPDGKSMFVSVGSRSNVDDMDTTPAETNRADVLQFNIDGSGQHVFAAGIRNCVGLATNPKTGELWCSVNERDGLGDNLVPDYITHVEAGGFYGWPWWYIGAHQDPRHEGKHPELKNKVIVPDVLLQPHNASLGITFYEGVQFPAEYSGDLFAAEHGSWNKSVRAGYEVIRVPLHQSGHASGEYQDFLTGFVVDNSSVWGRPVGVTTAPDGSLLVTDDASGSIWRVSYVGK